MPKAGAARRILYMADHISGPQAGTEGQLLLLVQHLDRSRYEPALAVLRRSEYLEHCASLVPVTVLDIHKLASWRSIFRIMRFALELRRQGIRLVHCFLNDVSMIAPPCLRLFGIRVLVSRRDMGIWYSPARLALLRLISPFVDRYTANCQAVGRVVHRREWVPRRKVSVIYNGVVRAADTKDLAPAGVPKGARIVGIVANLKPIKRIDVLMRAFARVRERCPDAFLLVVGADTRSDDGKSERGFLEDLARSLGIQSRMAFTGRVDDPTPYVSRFTVAVLCSESEGLSNALLEYMRAGRPVVCTNTGGNPELVQDGVTGFLVPVGDVEALAQRLDALLSDESLARSFGEAARSAVTSRYSVSRMVGEQMACYDDVLAGRRSDGESSAEAGSARRC